MRFFILIIYFLSVNAFSQHLSGVITYKKKADFNLNKSNISTNRKIMAEKMSKSMEELKYSLYFKDYESWFLIEDNLKYSNDQWISLANTMGNGKGVKYLNTRNRERLQKREFGGEKFLIVGNIDDLNWQISKESKVIDGYKVFKATTYDIQPGSSKNNSVKIIAWFTPEISISSGPVGYGNLPGLILELTIDEIFTYYVQKIRFEPIKSLHKPNDGEKVTIEEYNNKGKKLSSKRVKF